MIAPREQDRKVTKESPTKQELEDQISRMQERLAEIVEKRQLEERLDQLRAVANNPGAIPKKHVYEDEEHRSPIAENLRNTRCSEKTRKGKRGEEEGQVSVSTSATSMEYRDTGRW